MRVSPAFLASCAVLLACAVQAAAVPLPMSSVSAYVKTKVINEVVDSLPAPVGNFTKSDGDSDTASSSVPWLPASTGTSLTTSGVDNLGRSSSASGSVSAWASAAPGAVRVFANGAGSGHGGSTSGTAEGSASFVDFLRFSSTSGGLINARFGLGLSGTASATPSDRWTSAVASVHAEAGIPATSLSLLKAHYVLDAAGLRTVQEAIASEVFLTDGDIISIVNSISFNGRFTAGAQIDKPPASASFSLDVSRTSEFFIEVLTPDATYESASGVLYRTAPSWQIPEPGTHALVLVGLTLIGLATKRARRRQASSLPAPG